MRGRRGGREGGRDGRRSGVRLGHRRRCPMDEDMRVFALHMS